jgi:hypothetical protein
MECMFRDGIGSTICNTCETCIEMDKSRTNWHLPIKNPKFIQKLNQPERSKREDSQQCEMRCSEHCGNTVREAQ